MQKKNIAIASPLTSFSGYGQYGRSISLMLIQAYKNNQNINIILFDLERQSISKDTIINLEETKYKQIISYIHPIQEIQKEFFDVFMTVSVPQAFLQKGLINIGITALIEANRVHPILIQHCNRMDQVFMMSEFNINCLRQSMYNMPDGKQLKIDVPLSVLPSAFKKIECIQKTNITQYIDSISQKFLFLSIGEWLPGNLGSDRKDIGSLIATFLKTFANSENVGLLLKVEQGRSNILSQYGIRQRVLQIQRGLNLDIKNTNIYFISGNLSQSEMAQIYNHQKVKTYISYTHGESFGIPIMQFSGNTGKPLLIPYHSGMCQYILPQFNQIIISKEKQVPPQLFNTFYKDFMIPQAKWFTVDYQYGIYKMAQVYKNYNSLLQRAKNQQKHIVDNFNISKCSVKLKELLDKFIISEQEELNV